MNVKLTEIGKKIISVSELPEAKKIIQEMKEDSGIKEYAQIAANVAVENLGKIEILKTTAEITKNQRVYNYYSENSGNIDIWITVYALNRYSGFYVIGAYLSDIWNVTGENSDEIRQRMYIEKYTEGA